MRYIIYNKYTGVIRSTGSCVRSQLNIQYVAVTEDIMEGVAKDDIEIVNLITKEVVGKTKLPCTINKTSMLADGADLIVISNLPNPTDVDIDGERGYTISDGFIEFTMDTPGEYKILCQSKRYLDVEYNINAS